MRTLRITLVVAAVMALPSSFAFGAKQTVPRGAYIRKPVSSVSELATQITKDPVVRRRFAAHFGIPPERLAAYLRENVVITKVTTSTPKKVYVVERNGRMVAQRRGLKAGTVVFAMKDTGEPLLVRVCGNPVLKKLPPREKVKAAEPQAFQIVTPKEVPLPPPALAAAPPPAPAPPAPTPLAAPLAAPPPPPAAPPVTVSKPIPLWPLLALGGVRHRNNPPPIPEPPGAYAVAATGALSAAGYALMRARARRKTRPNVE